VLCVVARDMSSPDCSSNPKRILNHSNFKSGAATDEAGELSRRHSAMAEVSPIGDRADSREPRGPYEPTANDSTPPPHEHDLTRRLLHLSNDKKSYGSTAIKGGSASERWRGEPLLTTGQVHEADGRKADPAVLFNPKPGLGPRPIGGVEKLGLFSGFILGQAGFLGTMGMLIASYAINLITTFSLSAIASNGTVRGGGAYYLISRSLGPEFGGSIGIVFYLGMVFNTGMNAVGLIDCFNLNFGSRTGNWAKVLPESPWYLYLWATIVLVICTVICLGGSSIFARASNGLMVILVVSTLSIPLSALVMSPFESRKLGIEYTGPSISTFMGNLMPHLTKGAAGSQLPGRETFSDLFGILFPATGGIFAGASMSGDLKNPSKSIPRGTLYGLATTFILYTLVILAMAFTITRASFTRNANVIQDTNISGLIILAGEFATSLFSTLMGVIGSAKLLQALARDNLLPGFSIFGQGTRKSDEPTYAIFATYIVTQITMLCDLNQIASFTTMTYLVRLDAIIHNLDDMNAANSFR
jgi:potassium/chloride transporter 9